MKKRFDILRNNLLFKVTSLNSVSILLRAIIGVITSKVVAVYVGPQGMALLGNFRNFVSSVQTLGVLGMTNGIIKSVADNKSNTDMRSNLFSTLFFVGSAAAILVGSVLYFGATYWNNYVFGLENDFRFLIKFLGFVLPFYIAQAFLLSIINGLSKYRIYILISIIGNFLYLLIALFLIVNFRLEGALYSIVSTPVLLFVVTLLMLGRAKLSFPKPKLHKLSRIHVKNLGIFSLMALFSGLLLPQVMIQIRKCLITEIGLSKAGIWEGLQQLSNQYLLFATSLFTLYLLPRLTENKTDKGFREEVVSFYKTILPIVTVGMLLMYVLRKYIIIFLFSKKFLEMESLFAYQFIGDFFKIMSLTLAYQFIAKRMLWKYLITEGISMLVIYFSSLYFISTSGFQGVVQAHAVSYLIYLLLLLFVFRKSLLIKYFSINTPKH